MDTTTTIRRARIAAGQPFAGTYEVTGGTMLDLTGRILEVDKAGPAPVVLVRFATGRTVRYDLEADAEAVVRVGTCTTCRVVDTLAALEDGNHHCAATDTERERAGAGAVAAVAAAGGRWWPSPGAAGLAEAVAARARAAEFAAVGDTAPAAAWRAVATAAEAEAAAAVARVVYAHAAVDAALWAVADPGQEWVAAEVEVERAETVALLVAGRGPGVSVSLEVEQGEDWTRAAVCWEGVRIGDVVRHHGARDRWSVFTAGGQRSRAHSAAGALEELVVSVG